MAKIGMNYNKEQFDLLFQQLADEDFSEQEIRGLVEEALQKIDMEYLDAIEGILIGKDGKPEDISAYFRVDSEFLDEQDKKLDERNTVNIVSFLNKLAQGEYELLSRKKEIKKENEEVTPPVSEMPLPANEEKSESEIDEKAGQKYLLSDEEFAKVFLIDRKIGATIGKRYDMPMFQSFAKDTIMFSESTEKADLARRFVNTYEKIPTEYYEFLEKSVIGVNGVREDPRNYIEMTDDAYQKFFSFANKAPGEPLTPKEAKKVMNILANLAEGTIKLKDGLSERSIAYHKERLPKIYESESTLLAEALKTTRETFHQDKAIGEKGVETFLNDQKRAYQDAEKEYKAVKQRTSRFGATKEQKQERREAERQKLRERAKYDFVKTNRALYERENKKLRKSMDPQQTAKWKLDALRRKKELLDHDFSKKDEILLKKAEKDFAKKTEKMREAQNGVLKATAERLKKEGNPFPEHTAMRLYQIATGQTQLMPLITQQGTMAVYGAEKCKQHQEEAKRDFLQDRELSYASENGLLEAASVAYREAYSKYKELKQQLEGRENSVPEEEKSEPTAQKQTEVKPPISKEDKQALKALARAALDKGRELKALRERVIKETVTHAKAIGNPFPEHTAMRCEQIRAGQLGFLPLVTKAETLRETAGLSDKAKQVIMRANVENPTKEQKLKAPSKALPTPPMKQAEKTEEVQTSEEMQKPDEVEKPAATEIKKTQVVFPEGSIPSTTKIPKKPLVTPQKETDHSLEKNEQEKNKKMLK